MQKTQPICPTCSSSNRTGALFCDQCGNHLPGCCDNCGQQLRTEAKFCDNCGQPQTRAAAAPSPDKNPAAIAEQADNAINPLDYTPAHLAEKILSRRSAIEGERKFVTVMFADLQGSMELAEQVDAEAWHEILDEFFSILGEQVHRYEGTINQYTGDGIMALFGAPIAHEDHAQRACLAGLALRQNLREFGNRLRGQHGINFSARIGLNSGEVVVGAIGDDLRMDYTAQGHVVGLAARMEALAEPGHVYLTKNTERLIQGFFDLRALGAMPIKGSKEPIEVFALRGTGALQTRLQRSQQRGLSPFTGRDKELALLNTTLAALLDGQSRSVGISGDGGIGKSRLCFEFAQQCGQQNIEVIQASCVPYSNAVPLLPIQTLLRAHFGISSHDSNTQAQQKIVGAMVIAKVGTNDCQHVMQHFLEVGSADDPPQLPEERWQERLIELFCGLMPGRGQPRLLMIEDLHWLDDGSLQFLLGLMPKLEGTRTALMLNYRPEFDHRQLDLNHKLKLLPLDRHALTDLALSLLGEHGDNAALAAALSERSSGNPFFVEEAIQALAELGQLTGERGAYQSQVHIDQIKIPDTVQAILTGRIDALAQQQKYLLQTAAVIGNAFTSKLLMELTQLSQEAIAAALERLTQVNLVQPHLDAESPHWDFAHPVTREVAYNMLLKSTRRELHQKLAEVLETELNGDNQPNPKSATLAHHWHTAGNTLRAAEHLVKAGKWIARQDMHTGTKNQHKALEWLAQIEPSEQRDRIELQARSAILRVMQFVDMSEDEAEQQYKQALPVAEKLLQNGDKISLIELLISYGNLQVYFGKSDCGIEFIKKALSLSSGTQALAVQARLRLPILIAYATAGRVNEGLTVLKTADGSVWGEEPITEENYLSRAMRSNLLAAKGRVQQAVADTKACIAMAEQGSQRSSWIYASLVELGWYTGDNSNALQYAKAAVAEAEVNGSSFFVFNAYRALANAYALNGEFDKANLGFAELQSQAQPDRVGFSFAGLFWAQWATVAYAQGDLRRAAELADQALRVSTQSNSRIAACRAHIIGCRIGIDTSLEADAITKTLHEAEGLSHEFGLEGMLPFFLELRALLAERDGNEQAKQLFEEAGRTFTQNGAPLHAERIANRPLPQS